MLNLLIATIITTATPGEPTEIIGSAATPKAGIRKEVVVEQPENAPNPFGYIAPVPEETPAEATPPTAPVTQNIPQTTDSQTTNSEKLLVNETETVDPKDMNPLDYENKIENTIYQQGDRLIDVQSIPLKDISSAIEPNLQPVITDYPSL